MSRRLKIDIGQKFGRTRKILIGILQSVPFDDLWMYNHLAADTVEDTETYNTMSPRRNNYW